MWIVNISIECEMRFWYVPSTSTSVLSNSVTEKINRKEMGKREMAKTTAIQHKKW